MSIPGKLVDSVSLGLFWRGVGIRLNRAFAVNSSGLRPISAMSWVGDDRKFPHVLALVFASATGIGVAVSC